MLPDILKRLRESHNLSQAKVAEALQIPKGTYVTYEYGTREPNIEMINKIADFYNVSTDCLLGRDTETLETLEQLAKDFDMTALEKIIVKEYLSLPEEKRENVMDFLAGAIEKLREGE